MNRIAGASILAQGDILGTYQLLLPVGAGGMGRVWAARRVNSPTTQFVAVKTALEELAGDVEFERVFVDEARIASSIVHPNVCTIYELGAERSIPYLVMEWINGGSLHDVLTASKQRRIDYFLAARIVARICAGLHAAHELRDLDGAAMHVVHRDVSPQNILISEHGHVKIADFGVARAKGQLHKPTQTGELKGKLSYMAPEQLTTKTFDRRADVFALGCVLYQATTGQRPFHGSDALETMYKLLETDCEAPSAICSDYPSELETIVLRALSKDLSLRYQTAEEVECDLERFLSSHDRLITDRDVANLITSTLGDSVAKRAEALKAALVEVEQAKDRSSAAHNHAATRRNSSMRAQPRAVEQTAHSTDARLEIAAESIENTTSTTSPAWESQRPKSWSGRHRRRQGQLVAMVVGAITVLGAGWMLLTTRSSSTSQKASASLNESRKSPPSHQVEIRIVAVPKEASIELDSAPPVQGQLVLTAAPSESEHHVIVSLPGFTSERRTFVFSRSEEFTIQLTEARSPTKESASNSPLTAPVAPAHRGTTPIAAKPSSQKEPPVPTLVKPAEGIGPKPRKPKRSLDHTNPFSEP